MKSLCVALLLALQMVTGTAASADQSPAGPGKWRGYIVDRQCSESVREDTNPVPFLRRHSKDCSLMPSCARDGYSLYTDGKWIDLDKKASRTVIQAIKSSKRRSGFYAEVIGRVKGNVIQVDKIAEVEEPVQDALHNKTGEEK